MRKVFSGLVAAAAVMAAAPAMACGYSPCGAPVVYAAPVVAAPVYAGPAVSYAWTGCNACGGWAIERLPDPQQQYYWVNQGPTYTGPGNIAPAPYYREGTISGRGYGYNKPFYRSPRYGYYQGRRVLRSYY